MNLALRSFGLFRLWPDSVTYAKAAAAPVLRLAVVETARVTPARKAMHRGFASALTEAYSAHAGSIFGFKLKIVGAERAAYHVEIGAYDAVFMLGATVPRPLITESIARLAGKRGADAAQQTLHLAFNPSDEKRAELLVAAFPVALQSVRFVETLEEPRGVLVAVHVN